MVSKYLKVIFIFTILLQHNSSQAQDGALLARYEWEHRLIVINTKNMDAAQQIKLLKSVPNGLTKRNLLLVQIQNDTVWVDGIVNPSLSGRKLKNVLKLKSNFECLLIGKDGGIKNRSFKIKEPDFYFSLIDKMSMRQQEMKNQY